MSFAELLSTYGNNYVVAWVVTMYMALLAYVLSCVIAAGITVMRISPIAPLRTIGAVWVQIFRNIPAISLLVIVVYALPNLRITLPYDVCVILLSLIHI